LFIINNDNYFNNNIKDNSNPDKKDFQRIMNYQNDIYDIVSIPELKIISILEKENLRKIEIHSLRKINSCINNRESYKNFRKTFRSTIKSNEKYFSPKNIENYDKLVTEKNQINTKSIISPKEDSNSDSN